MQWLVMAAALFATAAPAQDEACEAACGNPSETEWRGLVIAPRARTHAGSPPFLTDLSERQRRR